MTPFSSDEDNNLSLEEAMQKLRSQAVAEPNSWHAIKTRRFGLHLAWCHNPDEAPHDLLRIIRELVRPYSEDLQAVHRYLPQDLSIKSACVIQTEKVPTLNQNVVQLELAPTVTPRPTNICSRCGRPDNPRMPLIGEDQLCMICATRPSTEP